MRQSRKRRAAAILLAALLSPLAAAQYDPDAAEPITPPRGSLVLGGGKDISSAGIDRFLELAGGPQAVVVFLTIGREEASLWDFPKLQASTREEADSREFTAPLATATGVWLAGENPERFLRTYAGTATESSLRKVLERGGVLGATGDMATVVTAARTAGEEPGLDLLPGSVLEAQFVDRQARLIEFLGDHRSLVGFGIEKGSTLIVEQRSIRTLGTPIYACIAASQTRSLHIEGISSRQRGDLLALSRAAVARTLPPFPPDEPRPPRLANGSLVIVGGGTLPPGLLQRFIQLCGGPDAPIVYVPCTPAETIPKEPRMVEAFRRAGARNVSWVHTKDRDRADGDESILGPLREARGIWFGGGRQWNLVDSYAHTTAHRLMHEVLARGGAIGGSSSGASIQADYMARGHPVSNRPIMAEGYEQGLGFLTGAAIDQHITQRNRLPDLRSLKNTYPQLLGIGLDEGAALIVRDSVAEVHALPGRKVVFFDLFGPAEEDDHTVLYSEQTYDMGLRLQRQQPAEPLPVPNDIVGTWKLEWTVSSSPRTATLRLGLDLEGTVVFDEESYPVRDLRLAGDGISFVVDGFAGFPQYRATRTGATLRGSLYAEGIHVAEFQGTKLDDGPSEYFDDARPARR